MPHPLPPQPRLAGLALYSCHPALQLYPIVWWARVFPFAWHSLASLTKSHLTIWYAPGMLCPTAPIVTWMKYHISYIPYMPNEGLPRCLLARIPLANSPIRGTRVGALLALSLTAHTSLTVRLTTQLNDIA